ncbi:Bardet-Biedl syndrome 7 protein homolog [Diabrotica virgifera virgifera]|uniref:Bardet-Biedl syndrome 7 protein homolog n=1 Tax=Diabrotica virgifera virgifera TaxID=50390 RepID=A0A6P7F2J6_DIAVI|nr:Bardet-Biedl syndrome 7 protein homolog [Diabrotica virgifera virgifera]
MNNIVSGLELTRVDYTIIGITNPNCLQLIPAQPKEPQRVAVADVDGILQVFSVKKEDIQIYFKTLPGQPIVSVKVAGATGTPTDKIFIASGNEVRGYTKKGKLFLTFDSGLTESISTMFVLGNDLFLCGKHIYTHFKDCKDSGSYLCGDRIVDVIAFHSKNSRRLTSLIACEGRMIRVLEHARVTVSMEVESSPTILHIYQYEETEAVLFGTADGRVGILDVENLQGFQRWLVTNTENNSSVCALDSYDLNGSEVNQVVVGRQDGSIEVYQVNIQEPLVESKLIYKYNCNESVSSLQCGVVAATGYDEILVVTYTGRVFGLTTQTIETNIDNSTAGYISSADTSQKIFKLKADIEELKGKIQKEREKYQLSSTHIYFNEVSAIPLLMVKDSFVLDKKTSTYNLSIEVPTAIDNILLQCNTEIDLLDVEKNSAVVSYCNSEMQDDNFLLATYRCQINTNRLDLKIRTVEGKKGMLQAYVTPLVQPKCSRVIKYEIKALSLHYRLHQFDTNRPFNALTIKGSFSLGEIHSWLSQCLPEVPEKPQIAEKTVLWFRSSLLDSVLECSYQKGEVEFRSDNVSTISTLKENLTYEATKKKIKIDISTSISDETINFLIKSAEEQLLKHQKLARDLELLDAINELEVTEEETMKCLSEKYKDLLKREKEIRATAQEDTGSLERLYGMLIGLYKDYYKFKGLNIKQKAEQLKALLKDYDYEKVIEFFRPAEKTT